MKVVVIIGPSAVGKMTVGQELAKITDLRLFHNHMTIEPVLEIFGDFNTNVIGRLREVIFEEYAATDNYGLIFTYMWAFDMPEESEYLLHVEDIFKSKDPSATFYYVELTAPQSVRLERNATENRLNNKLSKRDIDRSNLRLLKGDEDHRFESLPGEIKFDNYIKIGNTYISAAEAAEQIKRRFAL